MKAIRIREKGALENLELVTQDIPELQPDQILVKVKAAGINPVDWKSVINGIFQMPYTVGSDIAGIVEKVGLDVKDYAVGQEVIGSLEWAKQGAFAEYVVTEAQYLAHKPATLSFAEAAAVPLAALTAWQGLFDKLDIQPGQKGSDTGRRRGRGNFCGAAGQMERRPRDSAGFPKKRIFLKRVGSR